MSTVSRSRRLQALDDSLQGMQLYLRSGLSHPTEIICGLRLKKRFPGAEVCLRASADDPCHCISPMVRHYSKEASR
jgi:hypothetical protein